MAEVIELEASGDLDTALIELLAVDRRSAASAAASKTALIRARLLRKLGLLDAAEQICDRLDARAQAAAAVSVERLQIADARVSSGELEQARDQLRLSKRRLPKRLLPDWRYTYGTLLLTSGQTKEAAVMMGEPDQTTEALRAIDDSIQALQTRDYTRFNLAVALLRSGQEQLGLTWLDLMGRSRVLDPQSAALRDKANLALGWHFLSHKQGRTAMGVLGRVASEGLSAHSALLGLGWAQLEPNGERLTRNRLDTGRTQALPPWDLPSSVKRNLVRMAALEPELNGAIEPASFERDDPPKDRAEGLSRAIYIWSRLQAADPRDPAVQEARLASAYAYDQLGDSNAARAAYSDAVTQLQAVDRSILMQLARIENDEWSTGMATIEDRPALYRWMDQFGLPADDSSTALYALIDRYRSLTRLQRRLNDVQLSAVPSAASSSDETAALLQLALEHRLATSLQAVSTLRVLAGADMKSEALQVLNASRARITAYLKSALLSAARIEAQPDHDRRVVPKIEP